MTYELYWFGNPWAAKHFREAYKLRLLDQNDVLWRQGFYFLDALTVALHNGFNYDGKAKKPMEYMKEPLRIFPLSENEKKVKAEKERDKIIANLDLWKKAMGEKYGNRNSEP